MKAKIVRIGNSRGLRIPRALLLEAGIDGEVDLRLTKEGIIIVPVEATRAGWADAALLIRERGEDGLLDPPTPTRFDETEWDWEEA